MRTKWEEFMKLVDKSYPDSLRKLVDKSYPDLRKTIEDDSLRKLVDKSYLSYFADLEKRLGLDNAPDFIGEGEFKV